MPTYYSGYSAKWIRERETRRQVYASKLRGLGIIEGSNKWHALMFRKLK
jgi:hypothetical protein